MSLNKNIKLLYTAGRSGLLWFVWVIAIGLLILVAWLASLLPPEEMIRSFGSLNGGRIFQGGLILAGSVFIWPILWISNRYVTRIESDDMSNLTIQTWTVFGTRTKIWPAQAWLTSHSHFNEGKFEADDREVNAPWRSIKPAGGKKMIIDMQGDFPYGVDALLEVVAPSHTY